MHFRNFDTSPPIDVYLNALRANASNLTNSRDLADSLVATVELQAKIVNSANLSAVIELAPSELLPTFNAELKLLELPLLKIDPLISNYAPFDVEGGELDLLIELEASNGEINGYVKPLIRDLEIFEWKEDLIEDVDNPFQALWESILELGTDLLRNQSSEQLAMTIPIEGRLDDPDVRVLATIGSLFENAFIRAYQVRFNSDVASDADTSSEESSQ